MGHLFSTLRFRITLLHIAIFGMTLLIFSTVLYVVYQRSLAADFDKAIYNRALGIKSSISIDPFGRIEINRVLMAESGKLFPFQSGNEYIEIRTPDGKPFAHSENLAQTSLPLDPDTLALLQQSRFVFATIPQSGKIPPFLGEGNLRLLCMPLISRGEIKLLLQLGVSTYAHDKSMTGLRTAIFFVGVPVTLLLTGAGGWWMAGRAFLPINRIVSAAQRLGAERLNERLPVPEVEDELQRLSVTLNEMLERLERAFKSQERFVADASHELKTPLTILQGELDVLRQQPRSVPEYQEFLSSASEELRRLSQIIHNLLLLARADSGRPLELKREVRLDEIVLEVVERLQSFAGRSQVKLTVSIHEPAVPAGKDTVDERSWLAIRGEADLLASLFFNLVHNAIKHSAAGQTVEIRLEPALDGTRVAVRDFGTGMRPEELPRIFERFHRAENPTRRDVKGTGLGLAIVRWIAEAHGAQISVESKPAEGSVFTVTFVQR